jgi:hypothetical protein
LLRSGCRVTASESDDAPPNNFASSSRSRSSRMDSPAGLIGASLCVASCAASSNNRVLPNAESPGC